MGEIQRLDECWKCCGLFMLVTGLHEGKMIYNLCSLPTCWIHTSLITVSPLWASFETGLKNNGFVKHRCRSRYQGAQAEPRRLSENSTPMLLRSSAQPLSAQLSLWVTLGHPGLPSCSLPGTLQC